MYLLFYGDAYYPAKWDDFRGQFNTIEEAIEHLLTLKLKDMTTGFDWYQIVDLNTLTVVKEG